MPLTNLFTDKDDFFKAVDRGIEMIRRDDMLVPPVEDDKPEMKALLALFITGTIKMDPGAVTDPEMSKKLVAVRAALLAAYNLGRIRSS